MEQPVLPALFCPFPPAVNLHANVVGRQSMTWARQFALLPDEESYQRLEATRLGWLAARTHPGAQLEELQLISDWCAWLFVRDDYCDESGLGRQPQQFKSLHDALLAILQGATPSEHDMSLAQSLGDLRERTRTKVSAAWMRRFIEHVAAFFAGGAWEASNRAHGITPDVTTYIKMRPFTSGMYAFIELNEVIERIDLPSAIRRHPAVERLTSLANIIACWMNDLISFGKELRQGDVHNLVLALQHHYHLTLQQAVDRAAALHDTEMRTFLKAQQELPSFGAVDDARLQRHVQALCSNIRGNLDWSYSTGRYLLQEMSAARERT